MTAEQTEHNSSLQSWPKDGQLSHSPLVSLFLFHLEQTSADPVNHRAQVNEVALKQREGWSDI